MIYYEYTISNQSSCLPIIDSMNMAVALITIQREPSSSHVLRYLWKVFRDASRLSSTASWNIKFFTLLLFMHSRLKLRLIVYEKSSTVKVEEDKKKTAKTFSSPVNQARPTRTHSKDRWLKVWINNLLLVFFSSSSLTLYMDLKSFSLWNKLSIIQIVMADGSGERQQEKFLHA